MVQSPLIFSAVAEEVGRLTVAEITEVIRFESDGTATLAGSRGFAEQDEPVRWALDESLAIGTVYATGASARYDVDSETSEVPAEVLRDRGIRSAVASPILVEGRRWGAIGIASRRGPFPPDTRPCRGPRRDDRRHQRDRSRYGDRGITSYPANRARGRVIAT